LMAVARLEGPLQDDAALALGKIGDKRSLETLAGLQRTAPRPTQPAIAAAICLLGVNCESHRGYLVDAVTFADKNAGYQELTRGAAAGLAALGVAGQAEAAQALVDLGVPSKDPTRAPLSLALATVALRNTPLMLTLLEKLQDRGKMFVSPGEKLYEGMVIGIHSRDNDLVVNPIKGKQLTNVRASGTDEAVRLVPPIQLNLEYAVEFIADDELVEITPKSIRIRKRHLKEHERKKASREAA